MMMLSVRDAIAPLAPAAKAEISAGTFGLFCIKIECTCTQPRSHLQGKQTYHRRTDSFLLMS